MVTKIYRIVFLLGLITSTVIAKQSTEKETKNIEKKTSHIKLEREQGLFQTIKPHHVNTVLHDLFDDSYRICDKFFSMNTMGVVAGFLPLYLIAKKGDARLHRKFYDAENHLNIHQPPTWVKNLKSDPVMAVPFIVYSLSCFNDQSSLGAREVQLFLTGLAWSWTTKVLVKRFKTDAGLRPWNEAFNRHERSHGGNPSGHTTMVAYLATYTGLVRGPKYGIPCGLYAGLVASIMTVSNHHYISQVVAGGALGFAFGLASYSVLKELKLPENFNAGVATDSQGKVGLALSYDF